MFTSLDLLVLVFIILAGVMLLSIGLMFLIKNKTTKKVCFYIVSGLALYMAYIGIRIGLVAGFPVQVVLGLLVGITAVGSFVLERVFKNKDKVFLITQISSSLALVLGILTAFII